MNKNSIILLALAATAHVHGADNNSNKHDNELILGKRTYQGSKANNDPAKRQKTDPNPPKQSDISMVPAVNNNAPFTLENNTMTLIGEDLLHQEHKENGDLCQQDTAAGLNSQISVTKDGVMKATSNDCLSHKEYDEDGNRVYQTVAKGPNAKIRIDGNRIEANGTPVKHDNDGDNRHPSKPFTINGRIQLIVDL